MYLTFIMKDYMKKVLRFIVNILHLVKSFILNKMFGKIYREYKFRKRLKELKKRDPFIYK